jgi:Zn-finger nucleic acid-binding protein
MKTKAKKPKLKYPTLWGTYMDTGFDRELTSSNIQATIDFSHYKGHIMLRVLPEKPKKGAKHTCSCPSIQYPAAWLDGNDLDALMEILKEAKKQWLMAYRVAQYEEAKQKRQAQRKKAKRAPKRQMHLSAGGTDWSHDD